MFLLALEGDLHVGDAVRQADGTTGMVQAVVVVQRGQPMYNLTVAVAHTFFVGERQWLAGNFRVNYSFAPTSVTLIRFERFTFQATGYVGGL